MPRPEFPSLDAAVLTIIKQVDPLVEIALKATQWYGPYKMGQFGGPEEDLKNAVMEMLSPLGEKLSELVVAYDDIFAYLGSNSPLTPARFALQHRRDRE